MTNEMTNEEAIKILKEGEPFSEIYNKDYEEAKSLAIKALEFQDKFTDIFAQAIVNAGCDTLEEFCEKCGIEVKGNDRL